VLSAAVSRPARPRRTRYYVLRVIFAPTDPDAPPLVSVIPGSFTDLIAAWQVAGDLRARQPEQMFVAGEMCSTH
jgi:hypothetical protein